LLVVVSTQASPHAVWPFGQLHLPATHVCVAPHFVVQLPQCSAFVCASTQALSQSVPPFGQPHLPALHC